MCINLGCGFDDKFVQVDNGKITWFDVDLPDILAVRRKIYQDQIWNPALDRIESLATTKDYTYIKLDVDWNEYFEDIIGVTNNDNAPVEKIHFLVHGKTAHYLYTKPLHGSQHHNWLDDNTLDVTLNVKINFELTRTLLSYAPYITILSPQSLVEEHKMSLKKALEQYQ